LYKGRHICKDLLVQITHQLEKWFPFSLPQLWQLTDCATRIREQLKVQRTVWNKSRKTQNLTILNRNFWSDCLVWGQR
jgi:hypothetical protein